MNYRTPGVYVEEKSLFPPSVAQVATAIPAFIGYTEKAVDDEGNDISTFPYAKRIKSLLEYEQYFGKTLPQDLTVSVVNDEPASVNTITASKYLMYYALQMFYANGGGPCYIISVGLQTSAEAITLADLATNGLSTLKKLDEPTLILFPDAVNLGSEGNYHSVMQLALAQCQQLGDRFTIMDIYDGADNGTTSITNFRSGIGANFLKYGAAYTSWLKTNINYIHDSTTITFEAPSSPNNNTNGKLNGYNIFDIKTILAANEYHEIVVAENTIANGIPLVDPPAAAQAAAIAAAIAAVATARIILDAAIASGVTGAALTAAQDAFNDAEDASTEADSILLDVAEYQTAADNALTASNDALDAAAADDADIAGLKIMFDNNFENKLTQLLNRQYITIPPSSAIAGIYAMVDRTRGVWKAPANVSLTRVISPTAKVTDADQENLNVHESGKSINAIRSFTGKGIMVWGARTLAGNDNEWRYVSVRRFFNMVEESVKKATEAFVFEANDANTWVKVRAMIENFLTLQWRAGALAGATPKDAFYVKVGLGETMTANDILNGRMNVEIGMAAVRPAEFIILQFSHKMQES